MDILTLIVINIFLFIGFYIVFSMKTAAAIRKVNRNTPPELKENLKAFIGYIHEALEVLESRQKSLYNLTNRAQDMINELKQLQKEQEVARKPARKKASKKASKSSPQKSESHSEISGQAMNNAKAELSVTSSQPQNQNTDSLQISENKTWAENSPDERFSSDQVSDNLYVEKLLRGVGEDIVELPGQQNNEVSRRNYNHSNPASDDMKDRAGSHSSSPASFMGSAGDLVRFGFIRPAVSLSHSIVRGLQNVANRAEKADKNREARKSEMLTAMTDVHSQQTEAVQETTDLQNIEDSALEVDQKEPHSDDASGFQFASPMEEGSILDTVSKFDAALFAKPSAERTEILKILLESNYSVVEISRATGISPAEIDMIRSLPRLDRKNQNRRIS